MGHDETIRRAFSKQAARFGDKGLTLSSQEYLAWMVERLPLEAGFSNRRGMRPYRQDGRLKFLQGWSVLIGINPTGKASLP